jgi:hypothetical protein
MLARSRIEEVRDELRAARVDGYTTNVYGTDQQETAYYDAEDVEAAFEALLHDGGTEDLATAWSKGMNLGSSRAMRHMSDEPNLPLASEDDNPYLVKS